MLVTCVKDGLTVHSKVFKQGEIFALTGHLNSEMQEMSDDKMARRQVAMYGKPYFRRSTNAEIEAAVQGKVVMPEQLDSRERKVLGQAMQRKATAYQGMTDVIKGSEEEIANAEDVVEKIEQADAKEEVKATAKKKSTTKRTTKKAESTTKE